MFARIQAYPIDDSITRVTATSAVDVQCETLQMRLSNTILKSNDSEPSLRQVSTLRWSGERGNTMDESESWNDIVGLDCLQRGHKMDTLWCSRILWDIRDTTLSQRTSKDRSMCPADGQGQPKRVPYKTTNGLRINSIGTMIARDSSKHSHG